MFNKLIKKIRSNLTVYLFLLPSVLVMLLIVGYPLVNTIYYSFTDMTAETHNMDSPQGRKNTVRAVQELNVIVPNLKKLMVAQTKIVRILKQNGSPLLNAADQASLATARKERTELIKKIKDIEVTTDDGLYSFGTYYDLNLDKLLATKPPAGNIRKTILNFEENILSGSAGLTPRYRKEARTLLDKKKKHPTRFIGLRNFLVLLGFEETDQEIRDRKANTGLGKTISTALNKIDSIPNKKSLKKYDSWLQNRFRINASQGALLFARFNIRPSWLIPQEGGKSVRGSRLRLLKKLIAGRKKAAEDAYATGSSIRSICLDLNSLLRKSSRTKKPLNRGLAGKILRMKQEIALLYAQAVKKNPLLQKYLEIRYGKNKIASLISTKGYSSLKQALETEENNQKTAIAIRSDHSRGFGFWDIFLQTIIWTIVNVFLHFTIGLYLAHWLNKRLKGNTFYRAMLMIPWTVPTFVAAFSWRLIFDFPDGILNRLLEGLGGTAQNFMSDQWILAACIIVNVWVGVPFMMITLLGGLQTIPGEQYEAAEIDGANAFQKLMKVTLPGLKPVASVAVLLGFIWTFNMFNIIYLVTLGIEMKEKNILVTYAYDAFQKHFNFAESATYGVIILSLLLAFGSVYVRMLKKGGEV